MRLLSAQKAELCADSFYIHSGFKKKNGEAVLDNCEERRVQEQKAGHAWDPEFAEGQGTWTRSYMLAFWPPILWWTC